MVSLWQELLNYIFKVGRFFFFFFLAYTVQQWDGPIAFQVGESMWPDLLLTRPGRRELLQESGLYYNLYGPHQQTLPLVPTSHRLHSLYKQHHRLGRGQIFNI